MINSEVKKYLYNTRKLVNEGEVNNVVVVHSLTET